MPSPDDIPTVDADARVQQLQLAMSSMTTTATQQDVEDREALQRTRAELR